MNIWAPGTSRQAAHRVTTAHLGAAFPFMAQGSLGWRGVYLGQDINGAGALCYDPWELYPNVITSPNMLVLGMVGKGKSGFVKTYAWRQLAFGRRVVILDPKDQGGQGEYSRLCQQAGVRPIRLEPGGKVRLNPLDPRGAAGVLSEQELRQDQLSILYALAEAAVGERGSVKGLMPRERAALRVALDQVCEDLGDGGEPTIERIADRLLRPTELRASRLAMAQGELLQAGQDVAYELGRLCEGDLAGMFDGPTSRDVNFSSPLVSLDMSAIYQSEALGILMVCAQARLRRQLMADRSVRRIMIIDEGWAVLRKLAIARWLQGEIKLARALGVQVVLVVHHLKDLVATGAAGSEQVEIAKNLLSATETQVLFAQHPAEVQQTKELLQLNEAEAHKIPSLHPHVALMRVARRSYEFRHRLISPEEEWLVHTDQWMAA